ncbi:penicillin-insensitive murein endopeptidase [Polycladidibacter hongkongensis]|uniref:penicillin-insensitive murein endopeptidase n=1 Tax=Polycladidibacter hongkongensis TaxID=1647556 RepID=UPI00082D12D9|nr:penicillin-insensitive murein endopeptidase [Pseudovibrio hongkongensis]
MVMLRDVSNAGFALGLAALLALCGGGYGLAASAPQPDRAPLPDSKPALTAVEAAAAEKARRETVAAKQLFGSVSKAANMPPRSFGGYAGGCLAGAAELPVDGPSWQAMRLSRNRNWGHPVLVDFLQDLAKDAPGLGWNGLLIGDMAQPRGGPMLSGHASHQIGLDADIWLRPMPKKRFNSAERETVSAISMLKGPLNIKGADRRVHPQRWSDAHARLIRRSAQEPQVARIFVNPVIKRALCKFETGNRDWLRKVRPWWGHHYHFHVRMACPADSPQCKDQAPPPAGDGCGTELSNWLSDAKWVPQKPKPGAKPKPRKRKPQMRLANLPSACAMVLNAPVK